MMRGPSTWALAVRKPDGEIAEVNRPIHSVMARHWLFRLPIVRGIIALGAEGRRIVAVEPELSDALRRGLEAGESVRVEPSSMADGLSAPFAGERPIRICREHGVETVLVSEDEIVEGMRFLYGRAKLACEPAAAVGVAALLAGKVTVEPHDTVAVVVSGGNVAADIASAILAGNEGRNPS